VKASLTIDGNTSDGIDFKKMKMRTLKKDIPEDYDVKRDIMMIPCEYEIKDTL
jgi:hypothetical protein